MIEAEKAAFSFVQFKIPNFEYNEANHTGSDVKIGFNPSGEYNQSTGEFDLILSFITQEEENIIFELTAKGLFKFESALKLSEIPDYFYKNAIAIMFPYVRAFISTLTLQANTKLLRLGLMNLSELEKPLKENTSVVNNPTTKG